MIEQYKGLVTGTCFEHHHEGCIYCQADAFPELVKLAEEALEEAKGWRLAFREFCLDCDGTGFDTIETDSPCGVCGDPE